MQKCSPAIRPSGQPSTTPSLPQCEGARLALFRKVSRNQPGQPAATLVKDYPPPSCMLTYAYPLARHRGARLKEAGGQRIRQGPGAPSSSCICKVSAGRLGSLSS